MTKQHKHQKLLECKAAAYDSICRLRASVDSHRNFHRLVEHVMQGVRDFAKQLQAAPTTQSEQFFCQCADPACSHCHGDCKREASCQVYRIDMQDDGGTPMCDLCANDAVASGVFNVIEESCSNTEHD